MINQYNQHVNVLNKQGNEAQKKYLEILNQNKSIITISMSNQTNISMKHEETGYIIIPNQDNRPIRSIMPTSQVKTWEPSMCNQEIGTP